MTIPATAADAEHLLHVLYARSETRLQEKQLAALRHHEQKRLAELRHHEQLAYLNFLERQVNQAAERAVEADKELGLARATIRAAGLPVPYGAKDCAICSELYPPIYY